MRGFIPYLFVLLLIALILRIDFFFTIIYFMGAVYIGARVWVGRAVRNLRIDRTFTDHAFSGEQVTVVLTVRNVGRLPVPWVELRESLAVALTAAPFQTQVAVIGGDSAWEARYTLTCWRRGYYTVGPLQLRTGDLLGTAQFEMVANEPRRLTVYPRIVPLQRLGLPTRSPMTVLPARAPLFEDASRLQGVRRYQRGDAPRRIHWPASAHAGQLLVKQYAPAIARETIICLDLNESDYEIGRRFEATELAIVTAASLAGHIVLHEGLPAGLVTAAMDPLIEASREIAVPPRAGRAHLVANILEVLARVQVTTEPNFADLLRRTAVHFAWGASLVIITGTVQPGLLETLLFLQQRGFAVALALVHPGTRAAPLPDAGGIRTYQVWSEAELEVWR